MTTIERMLVATRLRTRSRKTGLQAHAERGGRAAHPCRSSALTPRRAYHQRHIPVKSKDGESPIKAGGRLLVIDGAFCKAYQRRRARGVHADLQLARHAPCIARAVWIPLSGPLWKTRHLSTSKVFETAAQRKYVADTDIGRDCADRLMRCRSCSGVSSALLRSAERGRLIEPSIPEKSAAFGLWAQGAAVESMTIDHIGAVLFSACALVSHGGPPRVYSVCVFDYRGLFAYEKPQKLCRPAGILRCSARFP
jgi:hypothetical protein